MIPQKQIFADLVSDGLLINGPHEPIVRGKRHVRQAVTQFLFGGLAAVVDVKDVQELKAFSPIEVTLSGVGNEAKAVQPLKA